MARAKPDFVDHLEGEFAPLGAVDSVRLFGGWQLRSSGRAFAVVLGDTLYFRAEGPLQQALKDAGSEPFRYVKAGGRVVTIGKFLSAPDAALDDPEALLDWARRALDASEPAEGESLWAEDGGSR